MDFIYDFERFHRNYSNKKIGVFFHTSLVQESLENLKSFFQRKKTNVFTYLPENCVYELKLLSQHSNIPIFREKASLLLDYCSTNNAWSYRGICSNKNTFLSSYHCDIAIFVFYEPAAAADFSKKMGNQSYVYILSYDPYDNNLIINSAIPIGENIRRVCKPLNNTPSQTPYKPEDLLVVKDRSRNTIKSFKMSELKNFHGGGEAILFTTPSLPGKLLKVYKFSLGDNMVNKLRLLITFSALFSGCVLPTELLYLKGRCVGYVMNKVEGMDLGCVLSDYNEVQRKQLIKDISVLLLELRMAQFIATDLSAGNIHIGKDGKIRVIDCDSMEFYQYPGGGITPPYGHPDITDDYFYNKLRNSEHVNFSYAVMLFEILLGWKNPLLQKGLGDVDPEWHKHKFPYANSNGCGVSAHGVCVNEAKLQEWCRQPLAIREGFVNVFTFQTTYDIGEWIKRIGII